MNSRVVIDCDCCKETFVIHDGVMMDVRNRREVRSQIELCGECGDSVLRYITDLSRGKAEKK